jgi:hypothetical protein
MTIVMSSTNVNRCRRLITDAHRCRLRRMNEIQQSVYGVEAERLRSSARWIAAGLAGFGAALVVGLELTGLGPLWDTNQPRFLVALAALGAGVLSFGWMLAATSAVFTSRWLSIEDLLDQTFQGMLPRRTGGRTGWKRVFEPRRWWADRRSSREQQERTRMLSDIDRLAPALFAEVATTLPSLHEALTRTSEEFRTALSADSASSDVTTRYEVVQAAAARTVEFANYTLALSRYARCRRVLVIGSVIALSSVLVFASAVNPAPAVDSSTQTSTGSAETG